MFSFRVEYAGIATAMPVLGMNTAYPFEDLQLLALLLIIVSSVQTIPKSCT